MVLLMARHKGQAQQKTSSTRSFGPEQEADTSTEPAAAATRSAPQRAPDAPSSFARTIQTLSTGWEFKQANADGACWRPVAHVPTNVHVDLLAHGLVADPFVGTNETEVQWVGEGEWLYRTSFRTPAACCLSAAGEHKEGGEKNKVVLSFEGLDTYASVCVNGRTVLQAENMFVAERVEVGDVLVRDGGENELTIAFASAFARGREVVEAHPAHGWGCWNGDNSRLAVRKAQYHWGWDWGPTLLTCGPWRPVRLEIYAGRIGDLWFDVDVADDLQSAAVGVFAELEGRGGRVRFEMELAGVAVADETVAVGAGGRAQARFRIAAPALWYPRQHGKQPLYGVRAVLLDGTAGQAELDAVGKRIGLRKLELVQRPLVDRPGKSFFFVVNNTPLFCGGSNWIPADSFVPAMTPDRYRAWVALAADGNQAMIRVWGGGLYEDEALYAACDELGVLVWQDFMFACGNYPAFPAFLAQVKREAEANLKRLRHHPCLAVLAGNNEDYAYAEAAGLAYDPDNDDAASWLRTDFPARFIYEKVLREACEALVPRTSYHFGSPFGHGRNTADPTVGDIHMWDVWHGRQERYQDYDRLAGRFVSEFGMQALPALPTIHEYLPGGAGDRDCYAQSRTLDHHNKAAGQAGRLALYLAENVRYAPEPLARYVYSTQLVQAESLACACRFWRRQWQGPGREYVGGALVWQLNDCWPCASWSIVDYKLRPKGAYFAVKRELADLVVGAKRLAQPTGPSRHPSEAGAGGGSTIVQVWAANATTGDQAHVTAVCTGWDVETGQRRFQQTLARDRHKSFTLPANKSTELGTVDMADFAPARTVMAVHLYDKHSHTLARHVNWPEPLKYLHMAKPGSSLRVSVADGGTHVDIRSDVPVKGLEIVCDGQGPSAALADNFLDVVPGELLHVPVKGTLQKSSLSVRYYGMWDDP